jgi:hypothetical protein
MGPNGPIPAIVVDQFGYPTTARKIAVIRDPQIGYDTMAQLTAGALYDLVDSATGAVVHTGEPTPWNDGAIDAASGDRAWWFDFSKITTPGRYRVTDRTTGAKSAEFSISDAAYRDVLKRAVKTFYYQRAGAAKLAQHADAAWADGASHLGPGQDPQSQPWPGAKPLMKPADPTVRDLRGGWYDAGDYNKYTSWTARNIIVLLNAYEENPQAFGDDVGIPESGNAVPDLLDEVKWGLDWLVRMQTADGSVLCIQALASASPPSAARGPSFYGPPTTSASLMAAAAFAYAAKIYSARPEPGLKSFAADLAARSQKAWAWSQAHPSVLYWNNDEAKQPGSKGLAAGQQEMTEAERALATFEAALRLYDISPDPALKAYLETKTETLLPEWGATMWEVDRQDAQLHVTRTSGLAPALTRKTLNAFLMRTAPQAQTFAALMKTSDPYRSPISDYTWGSNKAKAMQARIYQLIAAYAPGEAVRSAASAAALDYLHYLHGVNPLGLVYLTNMRDAGAEHSATTMFHAWFAKGTRWEKVGQGRPGPPPGYLVGGPNPSYSLDGCCTAPKTFGQDRCWSRAAAALCEKPFAPPTGQPPAKSYLQFNDGWPANSWAVSEPSTSYQAYYIRLLAAFVR